MSKINERKRQEYEINRVQGTLSSGSKLVLIVPPLLQENEYSYRQSDDNLLLCKVKYLCFVLTFHKLCMFNKEHNETLMKKFIPKQGKKN